MINKNNYIGYQGIPGSYSEEALKEYFGENVQTKNYPEFLGVFEALNEKEIDYGVLPLENSSTGAINDVYDLLRSYGFYIVGERNIKVDHNLVVNKGTKIEDLTEVYSHSQALEQSSRYLKEHPNWQLIPYKNTAISARYIKEENLKTKAAIASKRAAELYDLDILAENINYNKNNYTRFIIIGRNLEVSERCNKLSIIMTVLHEPGMLNKSLQIFSDHKVNLLKIESRPIIERSWEYFFYIDLEGNLEKNNLQEVLHLVKKNSSYYKLLGNYQKSEV
ncbi:chorismate mutase [Desulfonispora thiosulfatigenes DSM 11270]|uniref:Prephenate dehydratase n=1 Tax=Desulfonispora thiosulfatigenes DSM 11270 TaxID=656914 RepID=A0A1W1VB90_DESTI|nr:prephenate dehydratase [Desulfonispora thiosulfatigenes]SMB90585.1 chorismate mutase [Desulfonispora thiosulfatigenes DSM 11270]